MSITTSINRAVLILLVITFIVSCTVIKKTKNGMRYEVSDNYYGTNNLPISEKEYANQLNTWECHPYYILNKGGAKNAYLARPKRNIALDDRTLLNELEKSLNVTLEDKPIYIIYYDVSKRIHKKGEFYKLNYKPLKALKEAHPENDYYIILNKDYLAYDEDFIKLLKEGIIKIDSHGVLDNYIPYPGHFEAHWITIDTDLVLRHSLNPEGYKIFQDELKYNKPGMQYFNEGVTITKKEFQLKRNTLPYVDTYTSINSKPSGLLVYREREGQLDYESFKNQFSKSLGHEIDYSKPLVIAFFESVEDAKDNAHTYLTRSKFKKQIKQNPNANHVFILDKDYKSKNTVMDYTDLPVLIDKHGLIERVISKYDVSCENWITIKPDGTYYLCYGGGDHTVNLKALKEN